MFKNLKLKYLLGLSLGAVSLVPMIGLGLYSMSSLETELSRQNFNQLESITSIKKNQIENYFAKINHQIEFISSDKTTIQAMKEFAGGFKRLASTTTGYGPHFTASVSAYYQDQFGTEFKKQNSTTIDARALVPAGRETLTAQYLYISKNPHPLGSKSELLDAGDGSEYSRTHADFHPLFKDYLERFGYYDIFLVEPTEGYIVYSVFKELDYATSLKSGPYRNTNFARVFNQALKLPDPHGSVIADFEQYLPSYNAGASFIASPIYDGDVLTGVLIFQMPVGKINEIMQVTDGMGESGESYLVGNDFLMRSQSRFVEENTIIRQRVESESVKQALGGKSGSMTINDYRGVSVLSAYAPLQLAGLNWSIISEIDESEAFANLKENQLGILIAISIAIVFILVIAFSVLRRITRSIHTGLDVAQKISQGDLSSNIVIETQDEIGELLQSLGTMQDKLRENIEADKQRMQEEKDKAEQEKQAIEKQAAEDAVSGAANARIKTALDNVKTNVMMADADLNIIYMNDSVKTMMKDAEAELKKLIPGFDADNLVGANIDSFHKDPSHQRNLLANLKETYETDLDLGTLQFNIIANPVFTEDGARAGTVVEWENRTAEVAAEKERAELAKKEAIIAAENSRIKIALDNVSSNVMMADADLNIIYMNKAVQGMMKDAEAGLKSAIPSFDADNLVGTNIDGFHKNPAHQRSLLKGLTSTYESKIEVADMTFTVVANPVFGDDGARLGTVVEWQNLTAEVAVENEISNIVAAAAAGDFSERISMEDKSDFFERLAGGVNEILETSEVSLNDISRVIQALAKGDLTETITADYRGLFGQLKDDINDTMDKLSTVMVDVKSNSSSIASASEEVSGTAESLSQGASEQAASVEETSASIEQMGASINQNSENSRTTDGIATESANAAKEGGESVLETVQAMKDIAEKISIIEDIAYQTNMLALNAAIEAARAGEHGKGFAVVAAEVRKLAERSQVAASEISDLTGDSVKVAEKAGGLLEKMVPDIAKTAELVQEITAASEEQAGGVGQITGAMQQLDQVTQQNAAASEELAATAQEMRTQSQSLLEIISFFRLAEQEAGIVKPTNGADTATSDSNTFTGPDARSKSSPMRSIDGSAAAIDENQFERF